jgi:hypothetical protein
MAYHKFQTEDGEEYGSYASEADALKAAQDGT